MISIIVACDLNNVIGYEGRIPWDLPEDMKYFRRMTTGSTVVMGRKTYESIGHSLPNRRNVVVSKNGFNTKDDVIVVSDLKRYLEQSPKESNIFVIGGEEIYKQALPYVDGMFVTKVHGIFKGDAFFPRININEWNVIAKSGELKSVTNLKYQTTFYKRVD